MTCSPAELKKKGDDFRLKWEAFDSRADFDGFVEFAVMASSVSEFLGAHGLPGLHASAHALEKEVLSLFDACSQQELAPATRAQLGAQVYALCASLRAFVQGNTASIAERRVASAQALIAELRVHKKICFLTETPHAWSDLTQQVAYFGIQAQTLSLKNLDALDPSVSIVLVDSQGCGAGVFLATVQALRKRFAHSQLIGLNLTDDFDTFNRALGAGCDFCFAASTAHFSIMGTIVKWCGNEEEPAYRVLVVEDSKTASASIRRTLSEGGMESVAVSQPQEVLGSLQAFDPDMILMDMYLAGCTGLEVTRVIRQHAEFLSIPVVYLSADTNVALQVDALRLGGDHFLTKPFNPVVLNAVVKSKIERYRALRRSMFFDSLTGLLNHTTCKQRVSLAIAAAQAQGQALCVAMLDIDHFKQVNDSYGHAVGDHVIRSMAWLLKQRLRKTDEVGRYGGEEFLVVLSSSSAAQAQQLLDAIRVDFSMIRQTQLGASFSCTFSAGIAQWTPALSAEELVKQADAALYQAKRAGRNQVALQHPHV